MSPKFKYKILPALASGVVLLSAGGVIAAAGSNSSGSIAPAGSSSFSVPLEEKISPQVETRTETETVEIPYETVTVPDASLVKGETKVTSAGEIGLRELVYEVIYTDGVETDRQLVSDTVTKSAVNRIIAEGTYVAPAPAAKSAPQSTPASQCANGTYVNTAGETVCRPSQTNTGGATARCYDGSYSYSHSHRGTCSHHGGVAEWY